MATWNELGNGQRLQSGGFLSDLGVGGVFYACVLRSRVSAAGDQFKASLRSVGITVAGAPAFTSYLLPNGTYEDRFMFRVGSETDVLTVKRWITTSGFFAGPYDVHILGLSDGGNIGNAQAAQIFLAPIAGANDAGSSGGSDEPGWFARTTDTLQTLAKTPLYLAILGVVLIVGYMLWIRGK